MGHVFVSYVRDDSDKVDRLVGELRQRGVEVWLDRDKIKTGERWQRAIRIAIEEGAYFIACFSKAFERRDRTYLHEELTLAIDELRKRPVDRAWFIPVLLEECSVPDRQISAVETLRDIQWVSLYEDWNAGIQQLAESMLPKTVRVKPGDGSGAGLELSSKEPRAKLSALHHRLLSTPNREELKHIYYELQAFLHAHPADPEASSLVDKVRRAIRIDIRFIPGYVFIERLKDGSHGPEMVVIPAGTFRMGNIQGDGEDDEKPVHTVRIIKPFAIGKYAVTNAQYRAFRPRHDSGSWEGNSLNGDNQPVVNVRWVDAVAYTKWLSEQTGKPRCSRSPPLGSLSRYSP